MASPEQFLEVVTNRHMALTDAVNSVYGQNGNTIGLVDATIAPRERLSAARTYYVSSAGSDSNTGLTVADPFLTIQKAVDTAATLDTVIYNVTIQALTNIDSSSAPLITLKQCVGAGNIIILGDAATPTNIVLSTSGTGASNIVVGLGVSTTYEFRGVRLNSTRTGSQLAFFMQANCTIIIDKVDFNTGLNTAIRSSSFSYVTITDISFTDFNGTDRVLFSESASIVATSTTITLNGTNVYSIFAYSNNSANINFFGSAFAGAGTATGRRFLCVNGGIIQPDSANNDLTFLPGTIEGVCLSNGVYGVTNLSPALTEYNAGPNSRTKKVNEIVNNSAVFQSDDELQITLLANTNYAITAKIFYSTTAAADFQCRFTAASGGTLVRIEHHAIAPNAAAFSNIGIDATLNVAAQILSAAGTNGYYEANIIFQTTVATTLIFQWCQVAATAVDTTVYAGSYLTYQIM